MISVFEAEQDGPSVVLWEAGTGSRIWYPTNETAERAAIFLQETARAFHKAKEATGVLSLECYSEDMTPFEFVRHFINVAKSAGFKVEEGNMKRPVSEYW